VVFGEPAQDHSQLRLGHNSFHHTDKDRVPPADPQKHQSQFEDAGAAAKISSAEGKIKKGSCPLEPGDHEALQVVRGESFGGMSSPSFPDADILRPVRGLPQHHRAAGGEFRLLAYRSFAEGPLLYSSHNYVRNYVLAAEDHHQGSQASHAGIFHAHHVFLLLL